MTSGGAGPTTSHLSSEHGTHKKKTRDRIHTSPNLIRKKEKVCYVIFSLGGCRTMQMKYNLCTCVFQ